MKLLFLLLTLFLLLSDVEAEKPSYWDTDIPVYRNAEDVKKVISTDFWTKSISFSSKAFEPENVLAFYAEFFDSSGWKTNLEETLLEERNGWSSSSAKITEAGRPVFALGRYWLSEDQGGMAVLQVVLTVFDEGLFSGEVTVSISPSFQSVSPGTEELSALLLEDPKHIFLLHSELGVDPTQIHLVELPKKLDSSKGDLLQRYFKIIRDIRLQFKKLGAASYSAK